MSKSKKSSNALLSKPDPDIIKEINDKRTSYESAARLFHPLWYICFLRMHGQHYSHFQPSLWQYVKSEAYIKGRYAPRPKVDKVAKSMDDLISLLTDGFPVIRVKPGSDNPREEDIIAAEKADLFILDEQKRIDTSDSIEELFVWLFATGNYFKQGLLEENDEGIPFIEKVTMDEMQWIKRQRCTRCGEVNELNAISCTTCGTEGALQPDIAQIGVPKTDIKRNEDGTPYIQYRAGNNLGGRWIAPFQMFPHPMAKNFPTCPDWFIMNMTSQENIKAKFDEEVEESPHIEPYYQFQKALNQMPPDVYGDSLYFTMRGDDEISGNAIAWEYYKRPIRGVDNDGAYIVFSGNKILKKEKYPYREIGDGIFHYGWRKTGRFWYGGIVEMCFPINDLINAIHSQLNQIRKNHAMPKHYTYPESGVKASDYFDGKEVIECDSKDAKPDLEQPPNVGQEIPLQLDIAYKDYDEMSGWNEAIRGMPPKNVRTASGYQMLLERSTAPFGKKVQNVIEMQKKFWEFQIAQAQKYFDDMQIIKIGGGELEGMIFRATDIRGYLKMETDASVPFPKSKAVKQQRLVDMLQYMGGMFMSDPHTRHEFMKIMDLSEKTLDPMFERHHEQARKESIRMKHGTDMAINPFDNHEIHLYDHELAYFSDEVQKNPETKKRFEQHLSQHQQQYLLKQQQSFMAGAPQPQKPVPETQKK